MGHGQRGGAVGIKYTCIWVVFATLLFTPQAQAQSLFGGSKGLKGDRSLAAPIMGQSAVDSVWRILRLTTSRDLTISDVARDRDNVTLFQNIVSSASLAAGAADSSAVLDTHALRHLKLLLHVTPLATASAANDTGVIVRLAVQFREQLGGLSDSSSTFAEYMYGTQPSLGGNTATDTSQVGQVQSGNDFTPWSGEYVFTFQAKRNAHGSGLAVNGHTFYYPKGISYSLDGLFGKDVWFNRLSVRIRNISSVGAAGGGKAATVTAHLVGVSL